jgi:Domain of unknown function (DUF4278)
VNFNEYIEFDRTELDSKKTHNPFLIMNFFRHNSTKIPTSIELEAATMDLAKIRLRGSIFFYTPRPLTNARSIETEEKTVALSYRGNPYERELPTPPVETNGKTTTLSYRGNTYEHKLPTPAVETEGQTVTLIYRGHTYERKLQHPQPYRQPRAINWRWQ